MTDAIIHVDEDGNRVVELTEEGKKKVSEFAIKQLTIATHLILEKNVVEEVRDMRLFDTGLLASRYKVTISNNEVHLENNLNYASFLEFGTYAYHEIYGFTDYPKRPHPKKKNMKPEERKTYPKGMQPFAPVRRAMVKTIPAVCEMLNRGNK